MTRSVTAGLAVLLLAGGGTLGRAAPATPGEAARLTSVFERYVGHGGEGAPSPVAVVPHGESYTASFDLTRMMAAFSRLGFDLTAGDLTAELTPQPDGRWHVAVDGFPPVGIGRGEHALSFTVSSYGFEGVFDPAIEAFASSTTRTRGSTTHVRGDGDPIDVTLSDVGSATAKAEDSGGGTVTTTSTGSYTALDYKVALSAKGDDPAATEPGGFGHLQADALATMFRIDHEPVVALDDLWQFLVAHPSKQALVDAQADLKTKLRAVIPLASGIAGELTLSKLAVNTPLGPFGLDSASERFGIARADAKEIDTTTLRLAGLTLPDGLVPAWAASLVPRRLDLTQSYGPLAVTAAMTQAVDWLDLSAETPLTAAQQAALTTLLGSDEATLSIAPSSLATATLALQFEGQVRFAKPLPNGSATIHATGLDKTIESVRVAAANEPGGVQAIAALMAAKALAKAEGPDSYSWTIVAPPGGDVTINGNSLGAMTRSQPPKPRKTNQQP